MHNVCRIAKRDYLERVRTKSFLISTILIPLLMGGGIVVEVLANSRATSTSHITVVSEDQQLATDLQAEQIRAYIAGEARKLAAEQKTKH